MNPIDVSASVGVSRSSDSTRRSRSLSGLSDRELLSRVKDLVSRERAVTLEVLVHLIEVERRRLHLGLGYPSMFEYCLQHLGYSASAAARRIRAARCIREYPEVYGLFEKNEVMLITICLVAPILEGTNAKDLIGKIRGKSQREVETIVASYRPPVSMRDRTRPVTVAVSAPSAPRLAGPGGASTASAGSNPAADSVGGRPEATAMTQAQRQATASPSDEHAPPSPRLEEKFHVQFLAGERFMKKLEKAKALLSNKGGTLSYEFVLEAALDEFLKDHDPEERKKRRETRREKAGDRPTSREPSRGDATRHIPPAVRDAVFARDKGRCAFIGSNGKRCGTTHHLQIDHIKPYARGGTNTLDNLRLLCERHNKHEAERVLGANTIRRFRQRR